MLATLVARSAGREARADYEAWKMTPSGRIARGDSVAHFGVDYFGDVRLDALGIVTDSTMDAFERGFAEERIALLQAA